jgi:tetratricopeptide (TPR) repeat protein
LLNYLDHTEAAAREARIALDIMPHNAEAFHLMSNAYFEAQLYAEAYKYARKCLMFAGNDQAMRTRLALIYFHLGEKEKAEKTIDALIKNFPKAPEPFYTKALIVENSAPKLAMELATKACGLAPKEPRYHIFLGDQLSKAGDSAGALKEWEKALEYDSQNKELQQRISGQR